MMSVPVFLSPHAHAMPFSPALRASSAIRITAASPSAVCACPLVVFALLRNGRGIPPRPTRRDRSRGAATADALAGSMDVESRSRLGAVLTLVLMRGRLMGGI